METAERLLWLEVNSGRKPMEGRKLILAVLNQCLAQEYYDAFEKGKESDLVTNLAGKAQEVEKFAREGCWEINKKWCEEVKKVLSGARMQACVRKTLESSQWIVLPFKSNEEVCLFDLHGVDLVALSQEGVIYFLDIKTRKGKFEDGEGVKTYVMVEPNHVRGVGVGRFLGFVFKNIPEERKREVLGKGIIYTQLNVFLSSDGDLIQSNGLVIEGVKEDLLRELKSAKAWFWIS